jgi:putative flippase GtrA
MTANSHQSAPRQFLLFGLVGTTGFVIDTVLLYACPAAGMGLLGGRRIQFFIAAESLAGLC